MAPLYSRLPPPSPLADRHPSASGNEQGESAQDADHPLHEPERAVGAETTDVKKTVTEAASDFVAEIIEALDGRWRGFPEYDCV